MTYQMLEPRTTFTSSVSLIRSLWVLLSLQHGVGRGMSIFYCNNNNQRLITISPVNDRGEMVQVLEKIEYVQSGSFFKTKTEAKSTVYLSHTIKSYVICVYEANPTRTPSFHLKHKITNIESPIKVSSLNGTYLISTQRSTTNKNNA